MQQNMSNNYDINTLVGKMLTGEITEDESKALLQKAEADPSLKEKIQNLMNEDDFLDRYRLYRSVDASENKERFLEKIKDKEKEIYTAPRHKLVWLRGVAAAAVIALVVVGGWMMRRDHEQPKAPVVTAEITHAIKRVEGNGMNGATLTIGGKTVSVKDAQNALAQTEQIEEAGEVPASDGTTEGSLATKKDKEFWMVLDDGTYVHLNYSTTLIFPSRFVGNERRVKLKGEAYFAVAKDSRNRPFIVETANGDVHDYGTEFNVNTMAHAGFTSVVLVKGKVGVSSKSGKEYLLQPGEMATLQPGRTPTVEKVDVSLYTSWNTGNFFFDGCTLKELMGVLSRWYGKKVEFADGDIEDTRFTGSIDKYEPMAPTLTAIEHITGLKITMDEETIRVRRN